MASMQRLFLALLAGAGLAACSSSSGGSGPTITSFTATPSSLPAGGGSVTLAWNVTGATSLSIDQGVGAVSPATTGSTTAQVTASKTFTLTATGSSGNSTATAQVTVASGPATVTVSGTVTDEFGNLAPGETVILANTTASFSQTAVSSATGTFSIPSVPTPYNATIIDSGGKIIVQYLGLTRADPTFMVLIAPAPPLTSTLAGQLTGGTFPQMSGFDTTIVFGSPQTNLESSSLAVSGTGYSGDIAWSGPNTTTGTVYALQSYSPPSSLPTTFSYGALSNVTLQNMESLSGQNIALAAVTTGTLSGTITLPTGFTVTSAGVVVTPGPGAVIEPVNDGSGSTSFSYTTPVISGATYSLLVETEGAGSAVSFFKKTGLSATASGITAAVEAPPTLTLPVDAATGVTLTTPFTWSTFNGVYLWAAQGSGQSYYVFTTETTTTIPDLSSAGIQLPASASFEWLVAGIGPQTTIDEVAIPGGLLNLAELVDGSFGESAERGFTTAGP
jgi:hypothetical protein